LGLLDRFRKKEKKEEEIKMENVGTMTELEQLCDDDKETFEALLIQCFLILEKLKSQ